MSPQVTGEKTSTARRRLVSALERGKTLGLLEESTEIVDAIVELERCFIEFTSGDFIDMALGGEWRLEFAARKERSLENAPISDDFIIKEIRQKLNIYQGQGTLINCIQWQWGQDAGLFEAECTLQALEEPRSQFFANLKSHRLQPNCKLNLPPEIIVNELALTIPFEVFDPDGSLLDLVYADPLLRISRQAPGSKRAVGAAHVWSRIFDEEQSKLLSKE